MEQQLCLETLKRIEQQLQVAQAKLVAQCPKEELLEELMAARTALSFIEKQVSRSAREA